MIGIIGAMSVETNALCEMLDNRTTDTVSGIVFNKGKIGESEVVIATCGIGKVFAGMCAQTMILKYSPSLIINVGVGGSLCSKFKICDVVVANNVVQHDMDTSPLGDPKGMISGINKIYFECDAEFNKKVLEVAKSLNINTYEGIIASGDKFLSEPAEKAAIHRLFNADVCEMEGAAIGQVCYVNNIPFCVLRSISDGSDNDGAMDYKEFCSAAAKQTTKLMYNVLK